VKRVRNVTPASRAPQTSLTAREVREAIEERISKDVYALGQRLPPLRSIAAELGTSPSTVSRAVQEMIRNGWLDVAQAGIDDGGGVIFWRHAAGDALRDRALRVRLQYFGAARRATLESPRLGGYHREPQGFVTNDCWRL